MMGPMDLSTLVLNDIEHRLGSLTLSLVALLRWAGGNVRYRSLNAALGLSLRITALRRRTCLAWWSTHGCDTYLDSTAQMFGMRLRELHPPDSKPEQRGVSFHPRRHGDTALAPTCRSCEGICGTGRGCERNDGRNSLDFSSARSLWHFSAAVNKFAAQKKPVFSASYDLNGNLRGAFWARSRDYSCHDIS